MAGTLADGALVDGLIAGVAAGLAVAAFAGAAFAGATFVADFAAGFAGAAFVTAGFAEATTLAGAALAGLAFAGVTFAATAFAAVAFAGTDFPGADFPGAGFGGAAFAAGLRVFVAARTANGWARSVVTSSCDITIRSCGGRPHAHLNRCDAAGREIDGGMGGTAFGFRHGTLWRLRPQPRHQINATVRQQTSGRPKRHTPIPARRAQESDREISGTDSASG